MGGESGSTDARDLLLVSKSFEGVWVVAPGDAAQRGLDLEDLASMHRGPERGPAKRDQKRAFESISTTAVLAQAGWPKVHLTLHGVCKSV